MYQNLNRNDNKVLRYDWYNIVVQELTFRDIFFRLKATLIFYIGVVLKKSDTKILNSYNILLFFLLIVGNPILHHIVNEIWFAKRLVKYVSADK